MTRKIHSVIILFFTLVLISSPVFAKNLINDTVNVPLYSYKVLTFETAQNNVKIKISIEVSPGPIHLLILNEVHYALWLTSGPFQAILSKNVVDTGEFTATLGPSGEYYVIIDNVYQTHASIIDLVISTFSLGEKIGIAIGSIIGLAGIIFGSIWLIKKKKIRAEIKT